MQFINQDFPAVSMYADKINLTDTQRRQIESTRREYRERLNKIIAEGRKNWLPCHELTKAPVQGRPLNMKRAAECSRRAADLQYQANMLWFQAAANGAQILTLEQIRWLEAHYNKLQSQIPETLKGNGP
ncbi:MAG: hypothetical protein HY320_10400 [Armatimonadetes bacterium]|nr:hypothetical protein [Armatimonadota bacterium]